LNIFIHFFETDNKSISQEQIISSLLTLSEIACVSPDNESDILLDLFTCTICCQSDNIKKIISVLLDNISRALGYSSRLIWLEEHLSWLVGQWIKSKHLSLSQFPIYLFGFESQKPSSNLKINLNKQVSISHSNLNRNDHPLEYNNNNNNNNNSLLAKFLETYQSIIVPKLVFLLDKENLKFVEELMAKPLKVILRCEILAKIFFFLLFKLND
jgi:hypothetical protein